MEALAILVVLLLAGVIFLFSQQSEDGEEIKGSLSKIEDLRSVALLDGYGTWHTTIIRKSGHVYDERQTFGDAQEAIDVAIASCRRAGFGNIIVTENSLSCLEFYRENQDGRGKTIGGFRICAVGDPDAGNSIEKIKVLRDATGLGLMQAKAALQKWDGDLEAAIKSVKERDNVGKPKQQLRISEKQWAEPEEQNDPQDRTITKLEEGIDSIKADIAAYIWAQIKPTLNPKQLALVSSISESELLNHMANQLTDSAVPDQSRHQFRIPIDYRDENGDHYKVLTLLVADEKNLSEQGLEEDQGREHRNTINMDEFGFPEHDAWEGSVYELGDRPMRCDVMLEFGYTDSNGAASQRQIRASAFVPWLEDDHLVMGFCNHRKANRSFVTSRMTHVIDLRTGECIDDVDGYLITVYEASDYKKIDDFIDEKMEVVECLMYLARLDGNITGGQREIINDYAVSVIQSPIVTERIGAKLIKEYAEDIAPNQFRKLVAKMKKSSPECLHDLQRLGPQVVEARSGTKDGGNAALQIIG